MLLTRWITFQLYRSFTFPVHLYTIFCSSLIKLLPTTKPKRKKELITNKLELGYIGEFEYIDDHRSGKIVVQLNGRLNKCGVINQDSTLKLTTLKDGLITCYQLDNSVMSS